MNPTPAPSPDTPPSPPPATVPVQAVTVQAVPEIPKWWSTFVAPGLTLAFSIVTSLAVSLWTLNTKNAVQEERITQHATIMENAINKIDTEVNKVRDKLSVVEVNLANSGMTAGKFESAINTHTQDILLLRSDTGGLCKTTSLHGGKIDHAEKDIARLEKLSADISALRERLAALEATSKK